MLSEVTRQVPRGWRPIAAFHSVQHPRDGLVMCVREPVRDGDMDYVVWTVNTIEGGCHNGSYVDTLEKAKARFSERLERMS